MDPTTPVTDAEVEKYVREIAAQEAAAAAAKATPASPLEQPAPQTFKMTIGGQEMEFTSPEEASQAVNAALAQAVQRQPEPQHQGRRVTSDEDGPRKWTKDDQAKYVDLLTSDPIAASEYVDEFRFGVKNPSELIKQNMAAVQQMATQLTIDNFVASHKDYVPTPENAAAMQNILAELGGGRPVVNPMALEAAFAIADKRGLIKRPQAENQPAAYNPYLAPPPTAARNNSQSYAPASDFLEQAENIPLDKLEAFLSQHRG